MQQSCPKAPRTLPLPEPREFVAEPRWALRLTLLLGAGVIIVVCATQVVETLRVPERTRWAPAVAMAAGHATANSQPAAADFIASRVERTGIPVAELTNALRDGLDSEVVQLSTADDERRLREWSRTFAHAGGALTFFKRATTAADRSTYALSFDGVSIVGELSLARDELGRWRVIQATAAAGADL